jgi:hypothetical protein
VQVLSCLDIMLLFRAVVDEDPIVFLLYPLPCLVMPCAVHILGRLVLSCFIMSYLIFSCLNGCVKAVRHVMNYIPQVVPM